MKTILTFLALTGLLCWSAIAQTNEPAAAPPMVLTSNMYYDLYLNVFHNPASLLMFFWLGACAWLFDDLPFFNSRFVLHYTAMLGMGTYWLFAFPQSVPSNFPHPNAVFMVNGMLVGFFAALGHKQIIARMLDFFRTRNGAVNSFSKDKES